MTEIARVGDFTLQWGESLRWDDLRRRLYFVDCATNNLHWLEGAALPLESLSLPSLPTGVVLADDGRLVVALDDGLHVVDVDAGTNELLTSYPKELGARANDANADLDGGLVTGTLNMGPGPGSYWRYSTADGWHKIDDGIGNTNGPVVLELDGVPTLVVADTIASKLYAYDYKDGRAGEQRVFADTTEVGPFPDGACADAQGGVWSCLFGGGKIARYTADGLDTVIEAEVEQPSDVTFGGDDLDRMFFVSVVLPMTGREITSPNAGALMAVEGTGFRGRPEPRFRLGGP